MYNRINCFDLEGNSLDCLTQWDINQILYIEWEYNSTPIFHFCNTKSDRALVVNGSTKENGRVKAHIPNILLQESHPIIVFVYLQDDDNESGKTVCVSEIPVNKKPKPQNYTYEENIEYISWAKLESEARTYLLELESETNRFKTEYENNLGTAKENADKAKQFAKEAETFQNLSQLSAQSAKESENNAKDAAKTIEEYLDEWSIDNELSIDSESPVQNKVVTQHLNNIEKQLSTIPEFEVHEEIFNEMLTTNSGNSWIAFDNRIIDLQDGQMYAITIDGVTRKTLAMGIDETGEIGLGINGFIYILIDADGYTQINCFKQGSCHIVISKISYNKLDSKYLPDSFNIEQKEIFLQDKITNETYTIYISNGKLILEKVGENNVT